MDRKTEERLIFSTTKSVIFSIRNMTDESSQKATLAKLRNSIGKPLTENIGVIAMVFENAPDEFLGKRGQLSWGEDAILTAIQLFALHQQGKTESVMQEDEKNISIGASLGYLRNSDDSKSVDRRFNAMISSSTLDEIKTHLRHLIKLLKSREPNVKVDYALLGKDLFRIAKGYKEDVALMWARDYYRVNRKGEENNEEQ